MSTKRAKWQEFIESYANYAAIGILEALGIASPTEEEISRVEQLIVRSKILKPYLLSGQKEKRKKCC